MLEDAMTMDAAEGGGWAVAGVLTDLSGAVLTIQPGEAGLAGTVHMNEEVDQAANDARWEGAMP